MNRMKLRVGLFVLALTALMASVQLCSQETGSLPETKAPVAVKAAPAQATPAPAPLTGASWHPDNDYWRNHDQLLLTDFPWLARFKDEDFKLGYPAAGEKRVVFMGDSITEGWHLDKSFPGKPYVNRGISGQTTSQMVLRFHQDVIALKPKAVVILAGINDMAENTGPMTLEQTEDNHAEEVDRQGRTVLITCELAEAEFGRDQIHAYGRDWRLERKWLPRTGGSGLMQPKRAMSMWTSTRR